MDNIHETDGLSDFVKNVEITMNDYNIIVIDENNPDNWYEHYWWWHGVLLDYPIEWLMAKHIIKNGIKARKIKKNAIKNGHTNIKWGNLRNGTVETENEIINKMCNDNLMRPMRVTLTKNPDWVGSDINEHSGLPRRFSLWSDNNHSAISYIRRGYKKLKEIPFYFIDVSKHPYTVVVFNKDYLTGTDDDISYAIKRALRLEYFVENGGYGKYDWRIKDLMKQLI